MGPHEIVSFKRSLSPRRANIVIFDLLGRTLRPDDLAGFDLVLIGGSGAYSATDTLAPWLGRALESLRSVHASGIPAFASCWGFQGMAAAMGGTVVRDRSHAEVGTYELWLTEAGKADPVFGYLGTSFRGQMGHEDRVDKLPARATLLASSARVVNQAYRFDDAPIYCTQFHPELSAADLFRRFATYPRYTQEVAGSTIKELEQRTRETPRAAELVRRFVETYVK